MIFVSIGTTVFPFYRMVSLVERLAFLRKKETILFQSGYTPLPSSLPENVKKVGIVSYQEYCRYLKKARIVLAHGGLGVVMQSLYFQKPLAILPRISRLGEHTDDHQVCFARYLNRRRLARVISDEEHPLSEIETSTILSAKRPVWGTSKKRLIQFLHSYITTKERPRR